jgi:hypothetical protein
MLNTWMLNILPNCLLRPVSSKKWLVPPPLPPPTTTLSTSPPPLPRPQARGYLINLDLQRDIWAHLFSSLHISPSQSSLLLTDPLFALPSIQRTTDEFVFEDFNFKALYVADSPSLAHLYEASRPLMLDHGFSFTHSDSVCDLVKREVFLCFKGKNEDFLGPPEVRIGILLCVLVQLLGFVFLHFPVSSQ